MWFFTHHSFPWPLPHPKCLPKISRAFKYLSDQIETSVRVEREREREREKFIMARKKKIKREDYYGEKPFLFKIKRIGLWRLAYRAYLRPCQS